MKKSVKILAMILALVMAAAAAVSCTGKKDPDEPGENTAAPTAEPAAAEDAPETVKYVAMVGDQPIFSNEFYYFLYQAIREIYYKADGVYDENASDEENLAKMKEYFYSEDEEGVTYLRRAADRTLEIAQGFKIAYKEGKARASEENAKFKVNEEELSQIISYIDSEADYGASMYGCSRDQYFFYAYGMNVNDAKRYTKQQVYAELHEDYWSDDNGYTIGMDEPVIPTAPVAPEEPAENASDEDKAAYETKLATYNTEKAEYDAALEQYKTDYAKYEELKAAHYEKFRDEFNENADIYSFFTVRTLFLSKLDDSGNKLGDAEIESKKADINMYIGLVEGGTPFEKVVKGFSEDTTAASTLGLVDLNLYTGSTGDLPNEVIDVVKEAKELSTKPELIETEKGLYLIMIEGIVNFDENFGIVSDSETANFETVRANVKYAKLATLYNEYVEELMKKEEYALKDIDVEETLRLAKEYIEYTTEEK